MTGEIEEGMEFIYYKELKEDRRISDSKQD